MDSIVETEEALGEGEGIFARFGRPRIGRASSAGAEACRARLGREEMIRLLGGMKSS